MDLDSLIEALTDLRDATSGSRPVHVAIQPSYPLALRLYGVTEGADVVDDPSDEPETSEAVWLVVDDSHPEGIAYASDAMWEAARR